MAYDAHKNFAYSTVLTAPSPASSGTSLVVQSGDGAKFPAAPFNAVLFPVGLQPTTTNAEIVRVTAISTDTFTITRATESSSARTVVVGDQIAAIITAKTLTDVEVPGAQATAAYVATTETRANASYGALTTASSVTVTIGANGLALVAISCGNMFNNTTSQNAFMSFAVSGANTQAASDTFSIHVLATAANVPQVGLGATFLLTGLTPGSTTFTTQFRSNGSDTASFQDRRIAVIPF